MANRLTNRVLKLEDKANIKGERRRVIPFCCFYAGSDAKACDCKPYWTREPLVVKAGMSALYALAESGKCEPIPDDAEFID